jgi:hypothetical protein
MVRVFATAMLGGGCHPEVQAHFNILKAVALFVPGHSMLGLA